MTKPTSGTDQSAIFAGGCFWCVQADFDKVPGVKQTIAGYDGGTQPNPSYEKVCSGTSGYVEATKVVFDPKVVSYQELLQHFWRQIDPTVQNAQFCDVGSQYQTVIFYVNPEQKRLAEQSFNQVKKLFPQIYTEILPSTTFYPAEDYHQEFYKKSPERYKSYRSGSGREQRLATLWQDKSPLSQLTPEQYHVTQEEGTEPPFNNAYWDNHEPGIYVDIVTGEPLFSSTDKYDSGTGWPSFTKPIDPTLIQYKTDNSLLRERTEVRSQNCHLGHVFDDGPADQGGKRYCMNSAALRFIPLADLEQEGYGEYLKLFNKNS